MTLYGYIYWHMVLFIAEVCHTNKNTVIKHDISTNHVVKNAYPGTLSLDLIDFGI